MTRIQIITSDAAKGEVLKAKLSDAGYTLDVSPMTETLRKLLVSNPPDAVIIDLERAPATGRDLGLYLRIQKATRSCVLIYLGGKAEEVTPIRKLLPDAVFTIPENLPGVVKDGLKHPPAKPMVPVSVFAGYTERPLAHKLGIKPGMRLALVDPPERALAAIEPLPEGVEVAHNLQKSPDLALWFIRSEKVLLAQLLGILERVLGGKLWILWPKQSSGIKSDLTQQTVRKHGLDAGWVDYKVCSFDETWSGLCFTARKAQ